MEILTWKEFITQKARFDCDDCTKVKAGTISKKPRMCIECINCYGQFTGWYVTHKDEFLLDELRKKINAR